MDEKDLLAFYYALQDMGTVFTDKNGKRLSPEEMVKKQLDKKKKKKDERHR